MALFGGKKKPEAPRGPDSDPLDAVRYYHERTKHHFHRHALSLGYLDWDNQPDPFRRFEGAEHVSLPFWISGNAARAAAPYEALYGDAHVEPNPLNLASIAAFFEYSLAISAWKEYQGSRWALRCNPSSGNLHPTEGYLVTGGSDGLEGGVYHYRPDIHGLERRTAIPGNGWRQLAGAFPEGTFFAGLASVHWREAWKYGERAYRYCQHDAGHAFAAYAFAAAALGWRMVWLDGLSDDAVRALLGLDRTDDFPVPQEREHPDMLVAILAQPSAGSVPRVLNPVGITAIAEGPWAGVANRLSADHIEWDVIDAVAEVCTKSAGDSGNHIIREPSTVDETGAPCGLTAHAIIVQRRSAVAMDGETGLARDVFYRMLGRVMPRVDRPLWDAFGPPFRVHLGLFVHRVEGLTPGLYALARTPDGEALLRACMNPAFTWSAPPACPAGLPLYLLRESDCQNAAAQASCHQEIAGMGAFSLGMLAEFDSALEREGPWVYRRLFWETGAIGQVLYLEAEAAGLRATGIGCYYDDPVHELFGIRDRRLQSLYHFTLGGPVEDTRLTTLPPYSVEHRHGSMSALEPRHG